MQVKSMEERLQKIESRSINNLVKRLDRFHPVFTSSNRTGLNYWKGKAIIPLEE
jgi:hypothetical protein